MRLSLQCHGVERTEELQAHCERRLETALARFERRLGRVTANLSDQNGPRGGIDQLCRIVAHIHGIGDVVAEACEQAAGAAINKAVDRLNAAITHAVDRKRSLRPAAVQ